MKREDFLDDCREIDYDILNDNSKSLMSFLDSRVGVAYKILKMYYIA